MDATTFGNQCPQVSTNNLGSKYFSALDLLTESITTTTNGSSEDCLVLNVYTPAEAIDNNASLPVLVWIRITAVNFN